MTIEQTLIGSAPHRVVETVVRKHTRLNPQITHWLFLLRKQRDGTYEEVASDYMLLRDDAGSFVIALGKPRSADWIFPGGSMPRSYEQLLKPVSYRPSRGWWLRAYSDSDLTDLDPKWARVSGKYVVALRGLYLDDWAQAMKAEPGAICPS